MKFYQLRVDIGKRKHYAYSFPAYGYPTEQIHCSICGRVWNSSKKIYDDLLSYPIVFTSDYFADFITIEGETIINEKVKNFFESMKIQGIKFTAMPVVGRGEMDQQLIKKYRDAGQEVKRFHDLKPTYYRFSVPIGAKAHDDSTFYWVDEGEYVCKSCGYGVGYRQVDYFAPLVILLDSWNGSDFFRVQECGLQLFCTEQFKNMLEEQKFTGLIFKEIQAK